MTPCMDCATPFDREEWQVRKADYRCPTCRRAKQAAWRKARKDSGNPVKSAKMPREYHRAYEAQYRSRPVVKAKLCDLARGRRNDPAERHKHEARWKLNRAIAAGRVLRKPCEVCGSAGSQGHHTDYSKPLDVMWLCPVHHAAEHAKATGADK
jgi:hypothetical protein